MSSPLWMDGVPLAQATAGLLSPGARPPSGAVSRDSAARFWSTAPRGQADPTVEVMRVTFAGERLINYLTLEVARFPHVVWAEYEDQDTGAWYPFLTLPPSATAPATPARYAVGDSVPARVDRASTPAGEHPQHYGPGHWLVVSWRVRPVTAKVVRLMFQRTGPGAPPVDPAGRPVAYSLGARSLQVGYRINSKQDVPRYGDVTTYQDEFASSTDLMGSRVVYSLVEDAPRNVLSSSAAGTVWRSDPQPVGYAVVNFYADTRDAAGEAQVIDRWFVDPLTVGAHCNLYYSDDEPTGRFVASDQPLGYPIAQLHGTSATPQKFPPHPNAESLGFSHVFPSYVDVDGTYLQFDPDQPWWLALEIAANFFGRDGVMPDLPAYDTDHPIVSFGDNVLRTVPGAVEFTTQAGQVVSAPLDQGHVRGARWKVVVVYHPQDTEDFRAGVTLVYQLGSLTPTESNRQVARMTRPSVFRLGGYPDTADTGIPAMAMRAMILKESPATRADLAAFLADPQAYVRRAPFDAEDGHTTDSSILRLEPWRAHPERSPAGLYGGPGDRYADMVWTPVARDYALKKGMLQLPPTRAKYWKFEFTGLVAQPYETFVPIRREVQVFSTETVREFTRMGSTTGPVAAASPGVSTMLALSDVNRYADAVGALRGLPSATQHSPTEVLYASNLAEAQRVAALGWVWSFQPWHVGSSSPRFVAKTRHLYEKITVVHQTKVAFFAGLRRLEAYRLDYLAADDTEQYLEPLDDLRWVASISGVEHRDGTLFSLGGAGEVVSKTFGSYRPVRAVQMASQQSDPVQILPNDDFSLLNAFDETWEVYGDAELEPAYRSVKVSRGWYARTYGQVETQPEYVDGYASLEGRLFSELEGAQSDGVAGGGVQSKPVDPSGSGRLYAAVRVTSDQTTTAPVVVQIVSTDGDTVLAQAERDLVPGEEAKFFVGYTPGSATTSLSYAELEGQTYLDLDSTEYGSHESRPISGMVYVRAAQVAPTDDTFTISRLSLFDDLVQWSFSADGGTTWCDAFDIRNNPHGVLTFPEAGTALRWRLRTFGARSSVSALAVRPWYTGLLGGQPAGHGLTMSGPNRSTVDQYPPIELDPMWQQWDQPVPRWWFSSVAVDTVAPPAEPDPDLPPPATGTSIYTHRYTAVYTSVLDEPSEPEQAVGSYPVSYGSTY